MKRIVILGSSGTGKTTLGVMLSQKLHIQAVPLDSVYWLKDWDHISKEDFDKYMKHYLRKNKEWVIDGNYSNNKHFTHRLKLADTIIFLDFGTQLSLQGIHKRATEFKHQVRSDMATGCVEGIDQVFLQYVAFYAPRAKRLKAIISKYKNKKNVLIFKTRDELYNWYNSL